MNGKGTLIFFCGKMGAGRSTYSRKLASELNAVFYLKMTGSLQFIQKK